MGAVLVRTPLLQRIPYTGFLLFPRVPAGALLTLLSLPSSWCVLRLVDLFKVAFASLLFLCASFSFFV